VIAISENTSFGEQSFMTSYWCYGAGWRVSIAFFLLDRIVMFMTRWSCNWTKAESAYKVTATAYDVNDLTAQVILVGRHKSFVTYSKERVVLVLVVLVLEAMLIKVFMTRSSSTRSVACYVSQTKQFFPSSTIQRQQSSLWACYMWEWYWWQGVQTGDSTTCSTVTSMHSSRRVCQLLIRLLLLLLLLLLLFTFVHGIQFTEV